MDSTLIILLMKSVPCLRVHQLRRSMTLTSHMYAEMMCIRYMETLTSHKGEHLYLVTSSRYSREVHPHRHA